MKYDYLVVGSGLYGAVFAHEAKKKGKTTISCVINESTGNWKRGDVLKWIVTVK